MLKSDTSRKQDAFYNNYDWQKTVLQNENML